MQRMRLGPDAIGKIDKSDMLRLLLDFPGQCRNALDIAQKSEILFDKRGFGKIVFVGLGGSAIGADVVSSYLYSESSIPINVYREYRLPAYVDSSTLVFVLSYSGNTEEVLGAYGQAKEKGAVIIAISSGGRLKDAAQKDGITFIQVPQGLPPRCAIGYLSIVPLCVLSKLRIIKNVSAYVTDMIEVLELLNKNVLNPSVGVKNNIAKAVALKLFNKFVVVYSGSLHFDVCVRRFRAQLSENSKALASSHVFPEMGHGEIEGWKNPKRLFKDFAVLVFRDKQMHPRVAKSIDIADGIIRKENVRTLEVWSEGNSLLSRIFSLIYIGDFISYYLAILYKIDPASIERIGYLKKRLAENCSA